ncbi:hypothetical protein VNO77_18867 [Canavalia gladiata]|uniref:Uncharacterized protein n=1 Tax=Canavalia gladiata TaxID=3824 RepID=A0AAN9LQA9_CANGL
MDRSTTAFGRGSEHVPYYNMKCVLILLYEQANPYFFCCSRSPTCTRLLLRRAFERLNGKLHFGAWAVRGSHETRTPRFSLTRPRHVPPDISKMALLSYVPPIGIVSTQGLLFGNGIVVLHMQSDMTLLPMNYSSAPPNAAEAVSEVLLQRFTRTLWLTRAITEFRLLVKKGIASILQQGSSLIRIEQFPCSPMNKILRLRSPIRLENPVATFLMEDENMWSWRRGNSEIEVIQEWLSRNIVVPRKVEDFWL